MNLLLNIELLTTINPTGIAANFPISLVINYKKLFNPVSGNSIFKKPMN